MDLHRSEQTHSPLSSPLHSRAVTPTKSDSRGLLTDLAGWPSYSDMHIRAPGSERCGSLRQHRNLTNETPSGIAHAPAALQKSSHLPTPQSPGNMASYLITRTPASTQHLQPDIESTSLPTEFPSPASSSPVPFRPHSIPTPESSPLIAPSRNGGLVSEIARTSSHDIDNSQIPRKTVDPRSRASTPPHTPSWQTSARPVTPVSQSRPTTPFQRKLTDHISSKSVFHSDGSSTTSLSQRVKDEPRDDAVRIPAQFVEDRLASTKAAELRRLDYSKRSRRLTPTSNTGAHDISLTSNSGGQDTSLLWSSTNVGIINSPNKGKRIALFQETSEESFEESLMAGGYGHYRSDKPSSKLGEDVDAPSQLGDAVREVRLDSGLLLTEEDKRKKIRLAAFLDPPRLPSTTQLFPVEIEGCGRVLMKVEPSEPQTPPKPTSKVKRSRKRKRLSADMKQGADRDSTSTAAPEDRTVEGPNWPDAEFPWRSHLMTNGGGSGAEQERLRYIENFLSRDSDEDDMEEGCSSSSRRSPDEMSSRSPRPGRGKMYPLLTHSKGRRCGSTALSIISGDPADARTALLAKKSIRAVQLRLLRRQQTKRNADGDDGETLCTCQGRDDGRPLVQCDACQTWYHLECIGIQSTSELGREEDPWFCANCVEVKTPPPVAVPSSEPTLVPTDNGDHGGSMCGSADLGGYEPPFLNAGLNPSPATPWTRSTGPPTTPPRTQPATHASSGTPWEEPTSSSSIGPHTPQFDAASAFGDMVRVYGMTPGRSLEPSTSIITDELPFDPTSTPSRGIKFGLPFTTPKDRRWESSSWHIVRGSGQELFQCTAESAPLLHSKGRVGEFSHDIEGPSGTQGLNRTGPNNNTPVERDVLSGPRWMIQGLESPLGGKRSRRSVGS